MIQTSAAYGSVISAFNMICPTMDGPRPNIGQLDDQYRLHYLNSFDKQPCYKTVKKEKNKGQSIIHCLGSSVT